MDVLDFINSTADYNSNILADRQKVEELILKLKSIETEIEKIRTDFHRIYDPVVFPVDETGELTPLLEQALVTAEEAYNAYLICCMHEMDCKVGVSAENLTDKLHGFANSFITIASKQLHMTKEQLRSGAHYYRTKLASYIEGVIDGSMDVWSVIHEKMMKEQEVVDRKQSNIEMRQMRELQKGIKGRCVCCGYSFEEFSKMPNYCPDCGKKVEE